MFALSIPEARRLLSGINLASTWGKRDYLIILLMVNTGLRVGEATRLNVKDVVDPILNRPREEVYLSARITKCRKARTIPLNATAQMAILKILEFNRGLHFSTALDAPLFPGKKHGHLPTREVQRMFQKLREKVGMSDKVTPHVMRHTFATEVIRRGATLPTVQHLLGHKYLSSTQVYTHTSPEEKRAATQNIFQGKSS